MATLRSETKGYIGGGVLLATGLGVTGFILAVFALTYLNNKNKDDFTDDRKKQMGNTAWAYMAFLFAIVVFSVIMGWSVESHRRGYMGRIFTHDSQGNLQINT